MSLLDLMAGRGPMTFAEYMDLALYHPSMGYYATHIPGPEDDFRTSPSLSPWFGRLLSRFLEQMSRELGSEGPFTVVEVGAGSGHLALSLLEARHAGFSTDALRWIIVERIEGVETRQRDLLAPYPNISWVHSLGELAPIEGGIVANEVLDNFPVHVLEVTQNGVLEVHVTSDGRVLSESLRPLSDPRLEDYGEQALLHLEPGDRFEASLGIEEFCKDATAVIGRGFLLVIDYGEEEPRIWNNRPAGSVVSYVKDGLDLNVLRDPGERDITAHVNFSHLARALEKHSWNCDPLRTQRDLLLELGAREEAETLREFEKAARGAEALKLMSERSALTTLFRSGALGDLKVFFARKGV